MIVAPAAPVELFALPLADLQVLEENDPAVFTPDLLNQLIQQRYPEDVKSTEQVQVILSPFERFVRIALLNNDIGYNGHLYVPMQYLLISAIQNNNKTFIRYYFDRASDKILSKAKDVCLYLALKHNCDDEILAFLISRSCKRVIGDIPPNQFLQQHQSNLTLLKYDLVINTDYKVRPASGSDKYNLILGLINLDRSAIDKYSQTQSEFPEFLPVDILNAVREIYTREMHEIVKDLRDYLPTRFSSNQWLGAYLFLLDILLGKNLNVETDKVAKKYFTQIRSFGQTATILAMMTLNKDMYYISRSAKRIDEAGFYNNDIPYSEIVYDPSLALDKDLYSHVRHRLKVSIWLSGKIIVLNPEVPIIKLYNKVQADVDRISKLGETPYFMPEVPIQDMESAVWLTRYFDLKYLNLVPSTYVNYLNMQKMGFSRIRYQEASGSEDPNKTLKGKYEEQTRLFRQLYP